MAHNFTSTKIGMLLHLLAGVALSGGEIGLQPLLACDKITKSLVAVAYRVCHDKAHKA